MKGSSARLGAHSVPKVLLTTTIKPLAAPKGTSPSSLREWPRRTAHQLRQPTSMRVSPFRVGFRHSALESWDPMSASSKVAPSRLVPSQMTPVSTAFLKLTPLRLAFLKLTRSMTALVMSAPVKSEFSAYALDMTASVMLVPLKEASDMSAPESVFCDTSAPSKLHSLRSSTRSDTALACPMVFPTKARSQRLGSPSIGGSRISAAAGPTDTESANAAAPRTLPARIATSFTASAQAMQRTGDATGRRTGEAVGRRRQAPP
mmetsp:Transcript_8914/g.16028  ORF Transcript_8914/g.16028 Transcript_8914/m.16028 type:complete len:261 (+) Transcript_8914:46-828(+)